MTFVRAAWATTATHAGALLVLLVAQYLFLLFLGHAIGIGITLEQISREPTFSVELAEGLPEGFQEPYHAKIVESGGDAVLRVRVTDDDRLEGDLILPKINFDLGMLLDRQRAAEFFSAQYRQRMVVQEAKNALVGYRSLHTAATAVELGAESWVSRPIRFVRNGLGNENAAKTIPVPKKAVIALTSDEAAPKSSVIGELLIALRAISTGVIMANLLAGFLAYERFKGQLEAYLATPVHGGHILVGRLLMGASTIVVSSLVVSAIAWVLGASIHDVATSVFAPGAIALVSFFFCMPIVLCTMVKPRRVRWKMVGSIVLSMLTGFFMSIPVAVVALGLGQTGSCAVDGGLACLGPDTTGWLPLAGFVGWASGMPVPLTAAMASAAAGILLIAGIHLAALRIFNRIDLCAKD